MDHVDGQRVELGEVVILGDVKGILICVISSGSDWIYRPTRHQKSYERLISRSLYR